MNHAHRNTLCLLALLLLPAIGGCAKTLFSDSDPYNQSRIHRYWEDDSAKETRKARERASEMGFGFATGAGNQ